MPLPGKGKPVAHAWMTQARRIPAADGGPLRGGAPRAVWLTLGAVSIESAAHRLIAGQRSPHLVWNPATGEIVQLISVLRAARGLGAPVPCRRSGHARTADVNTEGRVCAQLGVLAHPAEPFTDGPLAGLGEILAWLDSWGIARRWPAGAPAEDCCQRNRTLWARGGHFGASQVPGCENSGPGAIDIHRLTGTQSRHVRSLTALPISA